LNEDLRAAIALRDSGEVEEARQRLLALVMQDPDDAVLNYHCAWAHDKAGLEAEAIPFYEKAIDLGLEGEDLRGAMLGLGSTFRALGRYEEAVELLGRGRERFPDNREFDAFLAMALHNSGDGREAARLLLHALAETSSDPGVTRYREAILFYADRLDETW
jgi:tetratricopeptide (TPR) repeat protein